MSGQQAFIVVPVPTQGECHDLNTSSQHIRPDTKEQIVKSEVCLCFLRIVISSNVWLIVEVQFTIAKYETDI